jgi:dTDP-4-amino-4,6-dideoxygalactose transaminase
MKNKPAIEGGKQVRDEFLVFGSPRIEEPEINELINTLKSGWLGTGPKTHKFEEMFKKYKNVDYALALNSCTAALHLACVVSGLKQGDDVITTPMTFCSTANVIVHTGAKPVFVDAEKDTMNINPEAIEKHITEKTKAIIIVHFAGRPCNMDAIMDIKKRYDLILIEDCAHAIEANYHNKSIGTFGDFGCFSFYVTKNVVTGEGGMLITNNKEYDEQARVLSLHGMSKDAWNRFSSRGYKHYQVIHPGFKYNMMDIQASLGIHQLGRVEKYRERRLEIWNRYNDAFKDLPCFIPAPFEKDTKHGLHLYTLLLDIDKLKVDRDFILQALTKENIGVGVHYMSLHLQPFYQQTYGYRRGDFPNAKWISDRTISLPLSAKLTDSDAEDVINSVRKILTWYEI